MDTDHQADEAWILSVQRKLYQWSKANPDDAWRDMWGWLTDTRACSVTPGDVWPPIEAAAPPGSTG